MKTSEFKLKILKKLGNEYLVLGEYINNSTKIKMEHLKCGHIWFPLPMTLTRNIKPTKCPKCSEKYFPVKNLETFKKEIFEKYKNEYIVLGDYKNNNTKIKMKHLKCNHEWDIRPKDILKGHKCPVCYGTPKKDLNKFKSEVMKTHGEKYVVIGDYNGTNSKIKMKHLECNRSWMVTPNNLLNRKTKCPHCSLKNKKSIGILKIFNFLNENKVLYKKEISFKTCKNKRLLKFDIFIPERNLLIEYDGIQHFKNWNNLNTLTNTRKLDIIKNKWVLKNKISLLRIDDSNISNISKILRSIFKKKKISSTTIETYNLFYIDEDSLRIFNNHKYEEL